MKQTSASTPKASEGGNQTRIEPLFNSAFARIFGREESKPLTKGLVNAVLRRIGLEPVEQIDRIDAEHTATEGTVDCKTPRMDVRIISAGRVFDLEAQGYPEDIGNRSLFYGAQLLCENTPAGTGYKNLPQVVVITLLDAPSPFPATDDITHVCRMHWDNDGGTAPIGTDRMLFAVVELEKVRKRYNQLTEEVLSDELLSWAYLLTKGYGNDAEVARIMNEVPDIQYFAELYGRAVDDPKVKRAYEDAVSAEREYQSRQDYFARLKREAIEEGLAEGRAEGRAEGIDALAKKLRELGADETLVEKAIAETAAAEE